MADIMYFGIDDRIPKILNPYFAEKKLQGGELSSLIQVKDEKGLNEALIAMLFDLIIFEQKSLLEAHHEFPSHFRKKRNYKGKLLLAGDDNDRQKILRLLESGWTDYLVMPPDRPLLIEKVELYSLGARTGNRQVYSLAMSQLADIAKPGVLEELSEFGCKLKSLVAYPIDDLIVLYSKAISSDGDKTESVLGRCFKTEPHPTAEGHFLCQFSFVGVRPDTLQNIRNHLRKVYATGKARQ